MTARKYWVIEGEADVHFEDSSQACIAEIAEEDDEDDGVSVLFQSWLTGGGEHPNAGLQGKRVRVEITVLDD